MYEKVYVTRKNISRQKEVSISKSVLWYELYKKVRGFVKDFVKRNKIAGVDKMRKLLS